MSFYLLFFCLLYNVLGRPMAAFLCTFADCCICLFWPACSAGYMFCFCFFFLFLAALFSQYNRAYVGIPTDLSPRPSVDLCGGWIVEKRLIGSGSCLGWWVGLAGDECIRWEFTYGKGKENFGGFFLSIGLNSVFDCIFKTQIYSTCVWKVDSISSELLFNTGGL